MDSQEIAYTDDCHWPSINLMKQLMKDLNVKEFDRAIEVGCGDGRYTRDHLIEIFTAVDMLDTNKAVIKEVKELQKSHPRI